MPVRRSLGEHGWRRPGRPWVGPSRPPTRSARADRPRRPATQPPNGPGGLRRWAGGGGLYSYDRLENLFGLGFRSADRIIPELQTLAVRGQVWLGPGDSAVPLWYQVIDLQPPQMLILAPHGDRDQALEQGLPWPTWAFVLRDLSAGTTRLFVRMRSEFKPTVVGLLANNYGLEPVHFRIERKLLLDSKYRAEQTTPS